MKLHFLNDSILNAYKDVILHNGKHSTSRLMNDRTCNEFLQLLSQIRESTLNYLEALCLWRQTAYSLSPSPLLPPVLRPFIWKGNNYTVKIVNDLDFLTENDILMNGLLSNIIPTQQVRCNPLMLTNNLEDPDTWMDPHDRAVKDAAAASGGQGQLEGAQFEVKLRLRYAERILLQELELVSSGAEGDTSTIRTEQDDNSLSKFKPGVNARRVAPRDGIIHR